MTADDRAIIWARRAESNAAIAARDVEGVIAVMTPDIIVSVAGGPRLVGRAASRQAFIEQFGDPSFRGYVREPETIVVHDPPTTATEQGHWLGRWQQGLRTEAMRGMYTAEWCHTEKGWHLQSEVFVSAPL